MHVFRNVLVFVYNVMTDKYFNEWCNKKRLINRLQKCALFNERDVFWCAVGKNVGFENDGKGDGFTRPVVILKKHNLNTCLIVPLTTKGRGNKYYFDIGIVDGKLAKANLSQIRLVDSKRLEDKIEMPSIDIFKNLCERIVSINFSSVDK